jgi:thiol-disulfide isomerase/thioredoxin
MIRRIDISTCIYIITMMLMFICGTTYSQEFVTSKNFDSKIAKDIVVVEFWAGWNSSNEFNELIKLKDCVVYRVDISTYMDIQMGYNVSAIPTIIIFDNGEEKERFKPNVMFQLEADKKTIQNSVDTLTLNKFQ